MAVENTWTFLTNHAHVLLCLVENPDSRTRDLSERVGITERAVQRIISELEEEGYVIKTRVGRRNHYEVILDKYLRHPVESHRSVQCLVDLIK